MKKLIIYFSVLLLFLFVGLSPAYAGWNEGAAAYQRGDHETAFKEFKPLAEQGNTWAQYYVGHMYIMGQGIPKDYTEAFKWYEKAAEQGNTWAQYNVGVMYDKGEGVPQDNAEALKWFREAAQHGYALAQVMLGGMYLEGDGVPRDYIISYMWLNLAAAQGNEGAMIYTSILEEKMTPEQIAEGQRLSRKFKVKKP